ncbi:hypothetical protein GCM10009069_19500 [Algimonas arctica]|uniref:Uncharacterized protein n=1 Tax=Algimonas arctica TaxID=1479486 RepID=A0A8J3CRI8_9PROT|nr:hypothetical protein GCM10009069_19500 [Algimonas arctica]
MRRPSYILETLGWALIVFTVAWITLSLFNTGPRFDTASNPMMELMFIFFSSLGYLLEGLILGTIAIVLARLARSPKAPALGEVIRDIFLSARNAGTNDHD